MPDLPPVGTWLLVTDHDLGENGDSILVSAFRNKPGKATVHDQGDSFTAEFREGAPLANWAVKQEAFTCTWRAGVDEPEIAGPLAQAMAQAENPGQ